MGPGQDHRRWPGAVARSGLQPLSGSRRLEVAPRRLERWLLGFVERHGASTSTLSDGVLFLESADGSTVRCRALLRLPTAARHGAETLPQAFVRVALEPPPVVLLLVRRGGYGVGLLQHGRLAVSKVGTRYVQSRTAAGGWSQQRFARRRDNQAGQLLDSAAATAVRLLLGEDGRSAPVGAVVVTGGDRALADRLLADPRLAGLAALAHPRHLDVPDPRADVLRRAAEQAVAVQIEVVNADADAIGT